MKKLNFKYLILPAIVSIFGVLVTLGVVKAAQISKEVLSSDSLYI